MSQHDETAVVGETQTERSALREVVDDSRRRIEDSALTVDPIYTYSPFTSERLGWSKAAETLLASFDTLKDSLIGIGDKLPRTLSTEQAGLTDRFKALADEIEELSDNPVAASAEARKKRQDAIGALTSKAGTLLKDADASVAAKQKKDVEDADAKKKKDANALLSRTFEDNVGALFDKYAAAFEPTAKNNVVDARKWFGADVSDRQRDNIQRQIDKCAKEKWDEVFPAHAALVQHLNGEALQVPDGANTAQNETIRKHRDAMTSKLAERPVSLATLKEAETFATSIEEERTKIINGNLDARIKERDRLKLLPDQTEYKVPENATPTQSEPIEKDRAAALATLKIDPPTPDSIKTAKRQLESIKNAVGVVTKQVAAKALVDRSNSVQQAFNQRPFAFFDAVIGDSPEYKDDKKNLADLVKALQATGPDPGTIESAETVVKKIDDRIAALQRDFDARIGGYRKALKSFSYLERKLGGIKSQDVAKPIRAALADVRLARMAAAENILVDPKFGELTDEDEKKIVAVLDELRGIARRIAAADVGTTSEKVAFDWQDSSTWERKPIRYHGNGTREYVNGLSPGYKNGLIKEIAECTTGDRHSRAVLTGVPMHEHTEAGTEGIAFCYNHLGGKSGREVEPVIYDYATTRDGNSYNWRHDASSSGPPTTPSFVVANRKD